MEMKYGKATMADLAIDTGILGHRYVLIQEHMII